jgi:hypothetical protein
MKPDIPFCVSDHKGIFIQRSSRKTDFKIILQATSFSSDLETSWSLNQEQRYIQSLQLEFLRCRSPAFIKVHYKYKKCIEKCQIQEAYIRRYM